jgi:putative ABC transport system permease protein
VNDTFVRVQRILPVALSTFALVLASVSLILAAAGLYATTSYLVSQRTREIGIRVALGARRRDVLRQVFTQGLVPMQVGGGVGLLGTLVLGMLVRASLAFPATPDVLFGIGVFDPQAFVLAYAVMSAVAISAMYVPARRATNVDPVIALRCE